LPLSWPFSWTWRLSLILAVVAGVAVYWLLDSTHESDPDSDPRDAEATLDSPGLEWGDCHWDLPAGMEGQCGRLAVTGSRGSTMRLSLLKLWREGQDDGPLTVHLPGGPGAAGGTDEDMGWQWGAWWLSHGMPGRLLVIDPRGTGQSLPTLHCPARPAEISALLAHPLDASEEASLAREGLDRCHAWLLAQSLDPSDFAAHWLKDDVLAVLDVMGEEGVRLLGLSHGSRIALGLLRRSPERFAAAVLDGVFPPEVDAFLELPETQAHAIEAFIADCGGREPCDQAAMAETVQRLRDRLGKDPALIWLAMDDQLLQPLWLTTARLQDLIFAAQVYEEARRALAPALASAEAGNYAPLAGLLPQVIRPALDPGRHEPVYWASLCAESQPPNPAEIAGLAERHDLVDSYPKTGLEQHPCLHAFARVDAPPMAGEAVTPTQPMLLFAGERDPVTPLSWARQLQARLPKARLIQLFDHGHGVVFDRQCAGEAISSFLNNPADLDGLDDCQADSEADSPANSQGA